MSSVSQEDEFTEVHRKRKKRKALGSPTLPTLQEARSPEQPPATPVRPKSSRIPNKIPVIVSGFDSQFKSWRNVMGELRQHHPSLKVSQVKELPKGDLLIIGDSMQDMLILQNENKMKAALGKNVRISLPKAYQINSSQNKCLAVKGVPTDISETDFLDFLNLNKISYAKAERLKSKKDGRVLPIFRQHVVSNQKSYAAAVSQNILPQTQTSQTFQFTAEQLTKFVATVVIQVAQPQVCYPNPRQDMLDLKSSMCRKISNAAKNILKVGITGKELFESIGSLSAPAPPKPFTFTNAKVNSASKHLIKPSTLKSTSPPPSISTKAVPKQPKATN